MLLQTFSVSPGAIFISVFAAYLVVILLLTVISIYYLIKTLKGGDYILPDAELYAKAGEAVGRFYSQRGLTLHDLIWELEMKRAIKVENQNSRFYSMKALKASPSYLREYVNAFLAASSVDGVVDVKDEHLRIFIKGS